MLHFLNDTSITCFAFGWQCLLKSLHVRAYIVGAATSKVLFATDTALIVLLISFQWKTRIMYPDQAKYQ